MTLYSISGKGDKAEMKSRKLNCHVFEKSSSLLLNIQDRFEITISKVETF